MSKSGLTPKQRLLNALLDKPIDRIPTFCSGCSQTVTVECMKSIGAYWPEAHKNAEKMSRLSASVYELTGLEVAGVPYCLTVEAEALGCEIKWLEKEDAIPQVVASPYKTPADIQIPDDFLDQRRIPVVLRAIQNLKKEVGDFLPIAAGLTGPFTLAGHLSGLANLLRWTIREPNKVSWFTDLASKAGIILGKAMHQAGADVIVIADPSASCELISPEMFRAFVKPMIIEMIEEIGSVVVLHICGNTIPILLDMSQIGAAAVSIDEKVEIKLAKAMIGHSVKIMGNISAQNTLLLQSSEDVKRACKVALDQGVDILAPGCGIAPNTPNSNIRAFVNAAREYRLS